MTTSSRFNNWMVPVVPRQELWLYPTKPTGNQPNFSGAPYRVNVGTVLVCLFWYRSSALNGMWFVGCLCPDGVVRIAHINWLEKQRYFQKLENVE